MSGTRSIIGAVGLAVIAAFILAAFRAEDLPLIGGGDTYYAAFTEAGGLKANDEVRVAGVRVGKVQAVELDGDHVRVAFFVDRGVDFGEPTGADIRVQDPARGDVPRARAGRRRASSTRAPRSRCERTTSPYDVVQAFCGLAEPRRSGSTPTGWRRSLDTMAALTENTPEEFQAALRGSRTSPPTSPPATSSSTPCCSNLRKVSGVLGDRRGDLVTLMRDGDRLFRALSARRDSVHALLVATSQLSEQLTGLVRDTRADLKPALDHLDTVVDVLNKNQENLDNSLRLMAPFYRVFANTLGNGPWFDTYIQNLPPVPALGRWWPDDGACVGRLNTPARRALRAS